MIVWGFFSTSVISLPLIFVWLPDRFISVPQQQLILQLEVMTFLWWQSGVWYCSSDSWVHLWPAFPAYFIRLSSLSFSYFSYEEAPTCKVKKDKHGQHEVLISWAEVQSHQLIYHMTPGTHHQAFTLTNTDMTQASSPPPSLLCCLLPARAFIHAV